MNDFSPNRRQLLKRAAQLSVAALAASALPGCMTQSSATNKPLYRISLAQWSLNRRFWSGEADPVNFAQIARNEFGFDAIEYVNQFYMESLNDQLVRQLRRNADEAGVQSLLIMVDREGALGDADPKARKQAVENHYRWADAAHELGCHSIRVNAQSSGSYAEQMQRAADGLVQLAEYCAPLNLNVLVENHGGLSSNAEWLAGVMKTAQHPRVGTLPDFGNFVIDQNTGEEYNKYQGVKELMPYAKAVSAKAFRFDDRSDEPEIDFERLMRIVVEANYRGWVGIEYEGDQVSEAEGIRKTRALLERVEKQLRPEFSV